MPIQKQIEGVRQHQVRSEVGVSVHWSADEAAARKAIKVAFGNKAKLQWEIGDLLNVVVPGMGQGIDNPEGKAKLLEIAEENGVSLTSVRDYRQVAAAFDKDQRLVFRTFTEALDSLRVKPESAERAQVSTREFLESLHEKLNKRFPSTVDEFRLTDEELMELKVLRLAIDNVIGARVQA